MKYLRSALARIAGLVFQGYPGEGQSSRQLQASSGLIYDVFAQFDPDNRRAAQTHDKCIGFGGLIAGDHPHFEQGGFLLRPAGSDERFVRSWCRRRC